MSNFTIYNTIASAPQSLLPVDIIEYNPILSKKEIENGAITRYFCRPLQQNSPSEIIEIDKQTFLQLQTHTLYNTIDIKWLIRGKLDDIMGLTDINTPVRIYTGVITANKLTIELANEKMPGIIHILTDYLKFYIGE